MRLRFQLVIEPDDQPPVITDLLRVERSELDPGSLGLHLSEAHELLVTARTFRALDKCESLQVGGGIPLHQVFYGFLHLGFIAPLKEVRVCVSRTAGLLRPNPLRTGRRTLD